MTATTIKTSVRFVSGHRSHKELRTDAQPAPVPARVPRVAKLLALAHRFEKLVRDGHVADYAELARLGHVTRARVTQIMDLLTLAPEIQEQILCWPPLERGKDPISERGVRAVVAQMEWGRQRQVYGAISRDWTDRSITDC